MPHWNLAMECDFFFCRVRTTVQACPDPLLLNGALRQSVILQETRGPNAPQYIGATLASLKYAYIHSDGVYTNVLRMCTVYNAI